MSSRLDSHAEEFGMRKRRVCVFYRQISYYLSFQNFSRLLLDSGRCLDIYFPIYFKLNGRHLMEKVKVGSTANL